MIDGRTYYQILGVPEDALLAEIQRAWRKAVKAHHEDVVPSHERQAAKERMFQINEAYEVLSHPDKRAEYDNAHMLNGGSTIELVRRRVRRTKELLSQERSRLTRDDLTLIESIIDYLDFKTRTTCFRWLTELLHERPDLARSIVPLAFDEQLHGDSTLLFDALLETAACAVTWDSIYLYAEDIRTLESKELQERNYNQLARILCHRTDLAEHFVYPAFQEQASGCESNLLPTLLRVAPDAITQTSFDHYVDTVNEMRWVVCHQLRSYNEQAIGWILKARPDLVRKPEKKKGPKDLPLPLRS